MTAVAPPCSDGEAPPLLVGLAALAAWDAIEPICPLCALYGKTPSDGSAPSRTRADGEGCVPIATVGLGALLEGSAAAIDDGDQTAVTSVASPLLGSRAAQPSSPLAGGATALQSAALPAKAKARATSMRQLGSGGDAAEGASGLEEEGGAAAGGGGFPSGFPLRTACLGGRGGWQGLDEADASRLMASHCYAYASGSGPSAPPACRWSSAAHEAELLAAIEEADQRMAEGRRHRHAAAAAELGGAAAGGAAGGAQPQSNFAVAKMRSLVSQEKRRFQEDGFDLDLTYITRRIIAMGFPSYGKEAYYRNPVPEVERFFQQRHGDGHYRIYNLCSERVYDDERRFNGAYRRYPFDDHNAPCPISLIADFVADASAFLQQHRENVVAIHCKAGKGRTGLMICCLLRATESNKLRTAEEALNFFGTVRTADGQGVTIPSQHRYVHYWDYILRHWQGVPPPRAPPTRAAAARLVGDLTAGATTVGGDNNNSGASAAPYRYIYIHSIVLDSLIFVGSSLEGDGSGGQAGGGAGGGSHSGGGGGGSAADGVCDVSFTIEENNAEVFDSRRNTLLVPSRASPFAGLPHHSRSFAQPRPDGGDWGVAPPQFGNTKTNSRDFTIGTSVAQRGSGGGSAPFAGYVFRFPSRAQLEAAPHNSPHRSAGVGLRVAGDVRVTLYYKRQGLLGGQKEAELLHFWLNTFVAQHMAEGGQARGGAPTAAEAPPQPQPEPAAPAVVGDSATAGAPNAASPPSSQQQQPQQPMRYVRLGKRELDGVHKDLRHHTYCSNIGVTVYFTVEDPFTATEIVPVPSAKAKAMPNTPPTPTGVTFMSGQPPPQHNAAAPSFGAVAASTTATTAPYPQQQQQAPAAGAAVSAASPAAARPAEKKEEKGFFKNIFKF